MIAAAKAWMPYGEAKLPLAAGEASLRRELATSASMTTGWMGTSLLLHNLRGGMSSRPAASAPAGRHLLLLLVGHAALGQGLGEIAIDLRILLLELDLHLPELALAGAEARHAHAQGVLGIVVADGEVARRLAAQIEMLMPPPFGRREHGAGLPFDALRLIAILPQQRIALAVENHDMGAGAVAMRLLVGAGVEGGDVRRQRIVAQGQEGGLGALAAHLPVIELELADIADEIDAREARAEIFGRLLEIVGIARIAFLEGVIAAEDELLVVIEAQDQRRVVDHEEPRRPIGA